MLALLLVKKICSLFLIMFSGMVLVRSRILKSDDASVISKLCMYLLMPCVIINAFQVDYTPEILKGLMLTAFVAAVVLTGLIIFGVVGGKILKLDPVEKASIIYSNAGNLVIPLVTSLFGTEWVIYTSGFLCVQLVLLFTHGKTTIQEAKELDFKKIFLNVNIICVAIGIALFATGLRFPAIIADTLSSLSTMIGPLSMLVTGMLIGGMDLKKVFTYKRVWMVAAFRLVIVPLICVLGLKYSGLAATVANGEKILLIVLIATMTPSAATVTQMAQIYGKDAEYANSINVLTTLLCIITMPLLVALYQL